MPLDTLKNSKRLNNALRKMLTPGPERGGLILPVARLVELQNGATDEDSFTPRLTAADAPNLTKAIGTWHTHPGASSNLSAGDAQTFRQWPDCLHAVVGEDGVSWYRVENGSVVHA
jgi:proteasome lid subunit RPN8/RPN11